MTVPDHIRVRDSRDRLIDLLGFGDTAPLRDVLVTAPALVPVDDTAELVITPGQADVRYLLRSRDGSAVGTGFWVNGTGEETRMETPTITESVTYRILARRIVARSANPRDTPSPREAYLHDLAAIRVGLDPSLPARIVAPLLVPGGTAADDAARIVDHNTPVTVEIDNSQPGVSYEVQLNDGSDEPVSAIAAVGDGSTVTVETSPMEEDVDLRVRAWRAASGGSGTDETILDIVLPLKVRANPTIEVSAEDPIIDHNGTTRLTIGQTQQSATYQLWGRQLSRPDFRYETGTGGDDDGGNDEEVISVPVPGEPDARIRRTEPPFATTMEAIGTPVDGNGAAVIIDLLPATDDWAYAITAEKSHDGTPSVVSLEDQVVVLTRPNPDQPLELVVPVEDGAIVRPITVGAGQSGVFYWFGRGSAATAQDGPAFFPEPDQTGQPAGVGVLRIGVDWFVGRDDNEGEPSVLLGDQSLLAELHIRAMKARTRVSAGLNGSTTISNLPVIGLESTTVTSGARARILVQDSVVGERYRPYIDETPIRRALLGNGSQLVFQSEPLAADTVFIVRIQPVDPTGVVVERWVLLPVEVT